MSSPRAQALIKDSTRGGLNNSFTPSAPLEDDLPEEDSLRTPLLSDYALQEIVVVPSDGAESKEQKQDEDIDLDINVKQYLMNPENFVGLAARSRIDIMGTLQFEMSSLQEHPAKQLAHALRHLILKNRELRSPAEENDPFAIHQDDLDTFFKRGLTGLGRGTCMFFNPWNNPFIFCLNSRTGGEICLFICAVATLCCASWATARPGITTCNSAESSTIKFLKFLLPIGLAISVAALMYRTLSDAFGDWADSYGLPKPAGAIGLPVLSGWMTYLLTSYTAAAVECIEDKEAPELKAYFAARPVDPGVEKAVSESSIPHLLVKYKHQGDREAKVRIFSRAVLNEWIKRIETLQNSHGLGPITQIMPPEPPRPRTIAP